LAGKEKHDYDKIFEQAEQLIRAGECKPNFVDVGKHVGVHHRTLLDGGRKRGITAETLEEWAGYKGNQTPDEFKEGMVINADGSRVYERLIAIANEDDKSPSRIMYLCGLDPDQWKVLKLTLNTWQMGYIDHSGRYVKVDEDGRRQVVTEKTANAIPLYQCKLIVAPVDPGELTFATVKDFFANYKPPTGARQYKSRQYLPGALVLEDTVVDPHFALKPHQGENEIEDRIIATTEDIIARCKGEKIEKILELYVGDIFHFDTPTITTTGGTQVEASLSPAEMFSQALDLLTWRATELSKIAPVEIIMVPGNHDRMTSYYLLMAIAAWFKDVDNIQVDTNTIERKYRKFGKCLVGWAHGDIPKSRIGDWLQVEAKEEWGETDFHEIHVGDKHHQATAESGGVIVRNLPTLAQSSGWEYRKAFVGALRTNISFVWDQERGLRDMWFSNVGK